MFGCGPSKTTAVDNVTFNCYEDQITIIAGPNGAGKSTLLNMLTGNVTQNYRPIVAWHVAFEEHILLISDCFYE